MAEIVNLSDYKASAALKAGFQSWCRHFGETFNIRTRLNDLRPEVLVQLSEGTDAVAALYYSLILGFLGHNQGADFESLDNKLKVQLVDIHLFLADQVRFEMMRRLGWLSRFCATQYPLFDMVRQFEQIKLICAQDPPRLAENHPGYGEYTRLVPHDQQVFIRRLFTTALNDFKMRYSI